MLKNRPGARALEELLGRLTVGTVVLVALFVVFLPLLPGWEAVQRVGETHFLRVLVGVLLLYVAAMIRDRTRLKLRIMDLMEAFDAFNSALYGGRKKVGPEAVSLLVTSLASKQPEVREKARSLLVRITGQDLGADPEAWRRWWDRHRASFPAEAGEMPAKEGER